MSGAARWHRRDALAALASCVAVSARAQTWPARPLRIVVPFTPGGSTDILARALAPKLAQALGQGVIIDNRPGAGGSLGAAEVARSDADGHTLLMGHIGTLAVNSALYPKLAYDPLKSFVPVAWVARVPNVLVANANAPPKTFREFKPAGRHGGRHLHRRAGRAAACAQRAAARALAMSSAKRIATLPDVPTVAEGGLAGFEADQWYGIVAPAGTPAAVVSRLNVEINKALGAADVAQQLATEGAEPTPTTPQAFGQWIAREIPRWAEVVKAGNVKPD